MTGKSYLLSALGVVAFSWAVTAGGLLSGQVERVSRSLTPTRQWIRPIGESLAYDARPVDLVVAPDGEWIVYASDEGRDSRKKRNFDIWMMSTDGTNRVQLTTNGSWDDMPCWDRSGKYIYFRSNRGGAWNVWRFSPVMP